MQPKRKIKASELVEQIRAGITDSELMEQYQLSPEGLRTIFKQLLEANIIGANELYGRVPSHKSPEEGPEIRRHQRIRMELPLRIYEIEHSTIIREGGVRDISEKGLCLRGIDSKVGDVKTFLVVAVEPILVDPFVFQGECRWARIEGPEREFVVGYEITNIPESSAEVLRQVIKKLSAMLDL